MIDIEKDYKEFLEREFVAHINQRCNKNDCLFCRNFDKYIKLIDQGLVEDWTQGNY